MTSNPLSRAALIIAFVMISGGCGASQSGTASITVDRSPTLAPVTAVAGSVDPPATSEPTPATSEPTPTTPEPTPATSEPTPTAPATSEPTPATSEPTPTTPAATAVPLSPLAARIVSLPKVEPGVPAPQTRAVPTRLQIPSLDIDAEIIAVGVDSMGEFDVPPASQVGWYEFGVTPGAEGSAVLAAHIAYNGTDGVFRHLDDIERGAAVLVSFDDGSTIDLAVDAQAQYDKDELPDDLFARDGDPSVVLITCGGDFNRSRSSYEDNVVAFAQPVD